MKNPTTVANCFDVNQAQQLRMLLDAAGIEAFIPDEMAAGWAPNEFFTRPGVRLQVSTEDEARARELLQAAEA